MAEEEATTDAGGLDTTVSNDMFAGSDIAETMDKAFESHQEPGQPRGEDGKFIRNDPAPEPREEEAQAAPVTEEPAGEETQQEDGGTEESESQEDTKPIRDVPIGWDKADSEEWDTLSKKQQDQFLKRDKQYTSKIQQSVEGKKFADSIRQVEAPYQAMIDAEGANTVTAYQDYLRTAYTLRNGTPEQRANVVSDLVRTFNVPIQGALGQEPNTNQDDIYVDPDIQAMQNALAQANNRIAQMEQRANHQDQSAETREIQSIDAEIDSFSKTKGHEHFKEVRLLMGTLMTGGQAQDMDEAYDMAINAHPEIRKKVVVKADYTERTKRAQEDADRAQKTAGTNLKSKGGGGKKIAVGKTMDQTMEEAYDRAMSR